MDLDTLSAANELGCKELHILTDSRITLNGVVAIYSDKRGPALGGCRFLPYSSKNLALIDAMQLAKSMALKSALADLPLGGGKAVLILPTTPFNREKILTAFAKFINNLNGRYITSVDSGTSVADMDYISKETRFVTSTSNFSYSNANPGLATARGVFQGILAAVKFKLQQKDLQKVHIAIQGIGNVGYNLVKLLYNTGAKITVCDANLALLNSVHAKFDKINIINNPEDIYSVNADLFAPCALGGILNDKNIDKLKVKIIAGGANNQLATEKHALFLEQLGILYVPDFAINAGGVIYVAGPILRQTEEETLQKIDNIYNTLFKIFELHATNKINTHQVAYSMALEKL